MAEPRVSRRARLSSSRERATPHRPARRARRRRSGRGRRRFGSLVGRGVCDHRRRPKPSRGQDVRRCRSRSASATTPKHATSSAAPRSTERASCTGQRRSSPGTTRSRRRSGSAFAVLAPGHARSRRAAREALSGERRPSTSTWGWHVCGRSAATRRPPGGRRSRPSRTPRTRCSPATSFIPGCPVACPRSSRRSQLRPRSCSSLPNASSTRCGREPREVVPASSFSTGLGCSGSAGRSPRRRSSNGRLGARRETQRRRSPRRWRSSTRTLRSVPSDASARSLEDSLTSRPCASILESSCSGPGAWTPRRGSSASRRGRNRALHSRVRPPAISRRFARQVLEGPARVRRWTL